MKRITLKQGLIILLILLTAGTGLFISWAENAAPASDIAIQALKSDGQVTVKEDSGLITFQPVSAPSLTGFIFYPGGRVDYRAYAPVLHQIAACGYFVALVPMPLNLAFLNVNAANQVTELYPAIRLWAVGGHSLGGVAASSFVSKNPNTVGGLVLWASYPADDSLTNATIEVISIYGTNDMAGMEPFDTSRSQLPVDTQFVVIDGGNHAQFGSYGPQAGDFPATISYEDQWAQVADATCQFLESLSQ
jgi:hypothetical protein